MGNVYESRWRAAVAEAERVNRMLAAGHLAVIEEEGRLEVFNVPFTITETEIFQTFKTSKGSAIYQWFENDREYDHGLYTPVKETRAKFRTIRFYAPVSEAA